MTLPPFKHMIKDALRTALNVIKGAPQGVIVEKPFQERRLSICQSCEWFIPDTSRCKKCGCLMTLKVTLKQSSCPIDKWGIE